jgi:hypothetical protein
MPFVIIGREKVTLDDVILVFDIKMAKKSPDDKRRRRRAV